MPQQDDSSGSTIEVNIGNDGDVGIKEIAKVLKGIQDTVYDVGEYLHSEEFRKAGKRRSDVEEWTKLYFREVSLGSFVGQISGTTKMQTTIQGQPILDRTLNLTDDVIGSLNEDEPEEIENRIKEKIEDDRSRKRIMGDLKGFWPGDDNEYILEVKIGRSSPRNLKVGSREYIKRLAEEPGEEEVRSAFGVLSEIRWYPRRTFEIRGPDGTIECEYERSIKKKIDSLHEKPVFVKGLAEMKSSREIGKIKNIYSIELFNKEVLRSVNVDDFQIELAKPLEINVSFNEGRLVLEHPFLNIIVSGKPAKYGELLDEFQKDFRFLYKDYYLEDDKNLYHDAIELKRFLNRLIEGEAK